MSKNTNIKHIMTLKEIKAQFVVGQVWRVERSGQPLIVNGNLGKTVLPAINADELRTVVSAKSELVCARPDGKAIHTTWPKAGEVNEARPGFLKFTYDNGTVCTFTKQ
jgi:hypothetical protein